MAKLKAKTQSKVKIEPKVVNLPPEKLLEALFFFWDGMDRASLNFFLMRDTARDAIADRDLTGDRLTLGIRKMEWQSGQDRIFKAFIEHERIPLIATDDLIIYTYKDIPVYLYIMEDNIYIQTLDVTFYRNETFNVPTPFDKFSEEFDS